MPTAVNEKIYRYRLLLGEATTSATGLMQNAGQGREQDPFEIPLLEEHSRSGQR